MDYGRLKTRPFHVLAHRAAPGAEFCPGDVGERSAEKSLTDPYPRPPSTLVKSNLRDSEVSVIACYDAMASYGPGNALGTIFVALGCL